MLSYRKNFLSVMMMLGFIVLAVGSGPDPIPTPGPDPRPMINTMAVPDTGGTLTLSTQNYKQGDIITLTATPNSDWAFHHWEGDIAGSATAESLVAHAHPVSIVADISEDIDVNEMFNLNGSDSKGLPVKLDLKISGNTSVTAVFTKLTYQWFQKEGTPVTIVNATDVKPTFSVQNSGPGLYAFELVIGNGNITSVPDKTSIQVFDLDFTSANPNPGTEFKIGMEQNLEINIAYSGMKEGIELYASLNACNQGVNPDKPLMLTESQDWKIALENTPNTYYATLNIFFFGIGDKRLALVAKTTSNEGNSVGTIQFTPPLLDMSYNQVCVTMSALDPVSKKVFIAAPTASLLSYKVSLP